jgi:hypothetical protein
MHFTALVHCTIGCACLLQACFATLAAAEMPAPEEIRRSLGEEFRVPAARLPDVRSGALARAALDATGKEVAALRKELRPWDKDPTAKLMSDGRHTEHGIRPNTQPMIAFAVVALWGGKQAERRESLEDLVAMLRFVAPTHSAGPVTAATGKKWQNQWQSALWAFQAGTAAWMVWDKLDPELQWLTCNLVAQEADRFVGAEPPFQIKRDTKAEENAWNSSVIALAANLLPDHPRAGFWKETAIRWQLSSFLTESDVTRNPVVDGKTIAEWGLKANIHPDYTLENHDRVHPSYMTTFTILLAQHLLYTWGGQAAPGALDFNSRHIYDHIKFLSHPDGQLHHPNGQDWELHRYYPYAHTMINVLFQDPEAALLETINFETIARMQARTPTGATLLKSEYFFPSLPQAYAYFYAVAFLNHAHYGQGARPVSRAAFEKRLEGVRLYEHGQFVAHRTAGGFASFSWGNRVMGMAIPFTRDLLGTPFELGYVGQITEAGEQAGSPQKPAPVFPIVQHVEVTHTNDHFAVAAILRRAGDAVEQRIGFVSLADGSVVYAEQLRALRDVSLKELQTGMIGVLNEPEAVYQDGPRKLAWAGDRRLVDGLAQTPGFPIPASWVNIDNRWGFVALPASEQWQFDANHEIRRGRREQFLFLRPPGRTRFAQNELIHRRAVVTHLDQSARETARLAANLNRQDFSPEGALRLELGKWHVSFDLGQEKPQARVVKRSR